MVRINPRVRNRPRAPNCGRLREARGIGELSAEPLKGEHHRADKTGWIKILFQGAAQLARDTLLDQSGTESVAYRGLN